MCNISMNLFLGLRLDNFVSLVVIYIAMPGLLQVLYNGALENACSELGARMSAMDSSSRNAGDMLDRLTLTYNRLFSPTSASYCEAT